MKRIFISISLALLCGVVLGQNDKYANISKYSDIYNAVLRELEINYVDSLKHDQLTEAAIGRMLYSLDPYTNYIPESEEDEVRRLRSGEYGGVGSVIMADKEVLYFTDPYENMPAQKAGIRAGDRILEIDGVKLNGKTVAQTSELLRGTPGTPIEVKVERLGMKKPMLFKFNRDVIQMPTIPYFSVIGDYIGYVVINDFIDRTSADFKHAVDELVRNNQITSLIIDLRDNGGGIVDQAVDIAGLFLPRNSTIVTMKGRSLPEEKLYKTSAEPLYPDMPLVVLINGNTASSSEILAGALQDFDRAVIVGERSFGKGLVQNIRRLPYNGYLKVTTAKYYTPSGRCVQAIDYASRQDNGSERNIPDSLTSEFKTKHGRIVRDGGGINPDVISPKNSNVNIAYYLYNQNVYFKYANLFKQKNQTVASIDSFAITDEQYQDFVNYVEAQNFNYRLESEKYLQELKEVVRIEGYDQLTDSLFSELTLALQPKVSTDLYRFKDDVKQWLEQEIVKRYYYQRGALINRMKYDKWLDGAVDLLKNQEEYQALLEPKKKN